MSGVLRFHAFTPLTAKPRLFTYPKGEVGAVPISDVELGRLEPGEFLNDNLIEFGLKYVHITVILESDVAAAYPGFSPTPGSLLTMIPTGHSPTITYSRHFSTRSSSREGSSLA